MSQCAGAAGPGARRVDETRARQRTAGARRSLPRDRALRGHRWRPLRVLLSRVTGAGRDTALRRDAGLCRVTRGGGATGGARSRGGVARGGRRMARQVTREGGGCHVAAWRVGPAWTVTPSLAATCTSPSPRRHEAPTRRRAGPVQGLGSRRPTTHTHRRLGFATRKAADRPREAPGLRGPRIPPSQSLRVSPSEPDPPSQSQGRDCSGRRRGGAMRPCRSPECPRRLGPRARVEARAGARPGRSSRLRLSPAGVAGMQAGEGGPGGLAERRRGGRGARAGGREARRAGSRRGTARGASGATSQSRGGTRQGPVTRQGNDAPRPQGNARGASGASRLQSLTAGAGTGDRAV